MASLVPVRLTAPHRGYPRGSVVWVSPDTATALVAARLAEAAMESATIEPAEHAVMPRPRPHRRSMNNGE